MTKDFLVDGLEEPPMIDVSIIIPVTRKNEINKCINSLILQDYDPSKFEVIIVKNRNINIDYNRPNPKIGINIIDTEIVHSGYRRNLGVKKAKGKYLGFLDDDIVPPKQWIKIAVSELKSEQIDIVCGPEISTTQSLGCRLSNAINSSVFGTGIGGHNCRKKTKIKFYNAFLCNCMMKKKVWQRVGGFNEIADYHLDDTEFFYIAERLGYNIYNTPELFVVHSLRPFPFVFLKNKFHSKINTGINAMIFYEIYSKIPSIKISIFAFLFLILGVILFRYYLNQAIVQFLYLYIITALLFSFPWILKDKKVFILLPFCFLATHLTMFLAFISGITMFILKKSTFTEIYENKKIRMAIIK